MVGGRKMKVKNSLKSLKNRHRANRVVRRKGRLYVINKVNKRFKARQGQIHLSMINEKPPNSLPYQTIHRPKSNIILLCDHSSSYIPVKYSNLGLSQSLLNKHIAYDIGAYGLTHSMASLLGANACLLYTSPSPRD